MSSKYSRLVSFTGFVGGGLVAALIGSLAPLGRHTPTEMAPPPGPEAQAQLEHGAADGTALATAAANRLDALEDRVRQLDARPADHAKPTDTKPAQPPPPPDLRQARHEALQTHQQLLELHEREATDGTWARQSTSSIREDLAAVAEANKFRLVNVDCRTTTCTAVLEWSSFSDAMQNFQSVAAASTRMKCSQQITLPEPEPGRTTYRATAFLDCEADRVGAS